MTHVDDLHEANDRESGDPETELLDPEELLDAIDDPQARATVAALLADHRYLCGLEKREEWVVTPSRDSAPGDGMTISCGDKDDQAAWLASNNAAQMWRRMLSVHAYEPIELEAPF